MTGLSVVPMRSPTKAEINSAWRKLNKLQLEAIEEPKKLTDREFFEALTSAEAEFKRLFNAMDRR